jgi:hypothetical protein
VNKPEEASKVAWMTVQRLMTSKEQKVDWSVWVEVVWRDIET